MNRRLLFRTIGFAAVLHALAVLVSCDDTFDPAGEIQSLRIIAVQAAPSYADPGEEVQLTMFGQDGHPTPVDQVELIWLTACTNPADGNIVSCFAQIEQRLEELSTGTGDPGIVSREVIPTADDGSFRSAAFSVQMPEEVLESAPSSNGSRVGSLLVFFAACAGRIAPLGAGEDPGEAGLPIGCFDDAGTRLGPDRFVPGFTEVFAFEDGRRNDPPPLDGLMLGGSLLPDVAGSVYAPPCREAAAEEGCGSSDTSSCVSYALRAIVGDVAEPDPGQVDEEGRPLREVIWVDYFADAGSLDNSRKLVSDGSTGLQSDIATSWIPPAEPGPVRLWAALHDSRGGVTVVTGEVMVRE